MESEALCSIDGRGKYLFWLSRDRDLKTGTEIEMLRVPLKSRQIEMTPESLKASGHHRLQGPRKTWKLEKGSNRSSFPVRGWSTTAGHPPSFSGMRSVLADLPDGSSSDVGFKAFELMA
ncbi:hypothetical protein Ac2012v2_002099 [Leucoagaricus gongylophorus]